MDGRLAGNLLVAVFLVLGTAYVGVTLWRGVFEWWVAVLSVGGLALALVGFAASRRGR